MAAMRGVRRMLVVAIETLFAVVLGFWAALSWFVSSWPDPGSWVFKVLGSNPFSNVWLVGLGLDFVIAFSAVFASIRGIERLIRRFWLNPSEKSA
jgi:hypothetical protein